MEGGPLGGKVKDMDTLTEVKNNLKASSSNIL